jgi:hypothetical protein
MSLSALPVPVAKVYDPRIDVLKEREYVITKGGNKVSYVPYRSMSTGASAMAFNVIPPSRTTFIDRKMYIQSSITVSFSGTLPSAPTNGFVSPLLDAPRSFPLSRALATATATIGNTNVSMQTGDVIDPLLRCMSTDELKEFNDGCPTALDRSQTYDCYVNNAAGLNVLGNYSSPILDDGEYARGYFNVNVGALSGPAGGGAGFYSQQVTFEVFEPVMLSPFVWQKVNHSGLIGLQNITLQYNFANNLTQLVWSGTQPELADGTKVSPTVNVNFGPTASAQSDAKLWVSYVSPSPLQEIPKEVSYNFYETQRFLTNGLNPMAFGDSQTVQSNNIQLKVIPSMIIAGVRRTKANQKYYQPDAYARIQGCAINFANTVGILSTASPFNLYEISKKNGLSYNYNQWLGKFGSLNNGNLIGADIPSGCGGLLVLKPSEDFGLNDGEASGLSGAFNFQLSLTVENIDPSITIASSDYELFVIVINEGQISVDVAGTGNVVTNIGVVSEADILKAETKPWLDYNSMKGLVGGDFLSSLKNWAKKGASIVHTVADLAPKASGALKSIGMGHGAGRGGGLIGSGLSGGKLLSQVSLKDRLKE